TRRSTCSILFPYTTLFRSDFPINPERVAPLLRRLVSPTDTRARIYDRDGTLLLDSSALYTRGEILRFDLPPPTERKPGFIEKQRSEEHTSELQSRENLVCR